MKTKYKVGEFSITITELDKEAFRLVVQVGRRRLYRRVYKHRLTAYEYALYWLQVKTTPFKE